MLFNSFEFLVFFPIVTLLFYLLPNKYRWFLLFGASCIFYLYFIPAYLLIIFFIILVDYFAALQIEKSAEKKKWLASSIAANIGVLAIFKYYNFFINGINESVETQLPLLKLALPIGLSFHTFQALSYTIEVYRGTCKAEKHMGIYALYVMFYPQLVAGPIERPQNLLPQLRSNVKFTPQNLVDGLRLMTWGFFKKLVIADKAAMYVAIVYNHPNQYNALNVLVAILLFSIQIYCDFSGYTDIARGAARTMGYNLMINFNRPFLSTTIREFWRRWHISLSTWFRDYVYIPLGGSKGSGVQTIIIILTVFTLSGLWHGAGWNFIVWGLLHGTFVVIAILFFKERKIKKNIPGIIIVNLLVAYTFIFFRSPSINHALEVINASFNYSSHIPFQLGITSFYGETGIGKISMLILLFYIVFMFFYEYKTPPSLESMNQYLFPDMCWFVLVIFSTVFFGVFTKETFIYFQF